MNIWGKIIGSTSGFALGGPIGALIGGAAGHAIDKMQTKKKRSDKLALKQIGFTIGIIVLSAKMAKADGKVTKQEILAFKNKIDVPDTEMKNVAFLWDQAKKSSQGYEVYAQQISNLLEKNSPVLEELLNLLIVIAEADGKITHPEIIYLKRVSEIFGFSNEDFERIISYKIKDPSNPYKVLGVSEKTPISEVKKIWKKLVTKHHPDLLISQGMPRELIKQNTQRLTEINNAWETIKKQS